MSEIELGPFPKYENVRNNAYWSNVAIDTRLKIDKFDEFDINTYKSHLQDCEKNPTIGLLARRKYITGKEMNYPMSARCNLKYLEKNPEIDILQKSIIEKIKTDYPKTKKVRQYIIDSERILLDETTKRNPYSILDKIKIIFKRIKL